MNDKQIAERILELSGGKGNIQKATHCITRLRLYIKDTSSFDKDTISDELGLQVVVAGGQHQVIIGPGKVDRVYDEFIEISGLEANEVVNDDNTGIEDAGKEFQEKQNLINRFIALLAGIFQPMLGILAGSGMIKGFTAILVTSGIIDSASTTYTVMNAIGDSFLIGLPVFVGYHAMKVFKGNPLIGATLGLILINPDITAFGQAEVISTLFEGTLFEAGVQGDFFGLPIVVGFIGYKYAVVPVIIISWIAAKVEIFTKRISPDSISLFLVSFVTILVSSVLGLLVLGPVFAIITSIVSNAFQSLLNSVPVVYGALLGGLWQVLVLFGLHWAIVPLSFIQLGEFAAGNVDKLNILSAAFGVSFATIGSVAGVMFVDRSKKTNQIAVPALITGIFGITEPAIYGVVLPKKIPFYTACVGGAVSGGFLSIVNNGAYTTGGLGVFKLPTFLNPAVSGLAGQSDLWTGIAGAVIGFVVAFILTMIFYKKPETV